MTQLDTDEKDPEFGTLISYLHENRGFDFRGYKRASLQRRIDKRMYDIGSDAYLHYIDLFEANPDEFDTLFNSILINVTNFFRDQEAWDVIAEKVLPELLKGKSRANPLRIWSAGCASGQEAFSAAMMVAEAIGIEQACQNLRIYATDVDEDTLGVARAGIYTRKEVESLPRGYLKRYFEISGNTCNFLYDLRKTVIFGRHNLVSDAPISRIDLLIYLDLPTQKKVVPRLHYSLRIVIGKLYSFFYISHKFDMSFFVIFYARAR